MARASATPPTPPAAAPFRQRAPVDRRQPLHRQFYIQKIRGARRRTSPGPHLRHGPDVTGQPEFQIGDGCLLISSSASTRPKPATRPLVSEVASARRSNHLPLQLRATGVTKRQRVFALNDRPLVICDYSKGARPRSPLLRRSLHHISTTAAQFIYAGMSAQGIECIESIRRRYDGQRRNPWNEAECGHHYARAMAAWSGILALSGFSYDAAAQRLEVKPRRRLALFRSFWSTANGWGWFELGPKLTIHVEHGALALNEVQLKGRTVKLTGRVLIQAGTNWSC